MCIFRSPGPLSKWDIEVDGISAGFVGSNRYRCLDIAAGRRAVRLTQVAGGAGWLAAGAGSGMVVQLAPDVTTAVTAAAGATVGLVCDAQVKAMTVHLRCDPVADPSEIARLKTEHKPEDKLDP